MLIVKQVPEYPGYVFSSDGNIQGPGGVSTRHTPVWLKYSTHPMGYETVTISVSGKRATRTVHSLICEVFHGPRPSHNHVVCHKNDNKLDNRADNLYWGTHQDNADDRARNGRNRQGSTNGSAKLTEAQVLEIRKLYRTTKITHIQLGALYNVSRGTINNVLNNHFWKHI